MPAKVASIEYDPNRSTRIALLHYLRRREALHPGAPGPAGGRHGGGRPRSGYQAGQLLPLANIPAGTLVHNVELKPGKGGQMARAAGAYAQLMAKEGEARPL